MRDIIFLDIETTSLRRPWMAGPKQVWDVGYVRWPGGDRVNRHERQFYVELPSRGDADPFSLRVGHFHERYPAKETPRHYGAFLTAQMAAMTLSSSFRDALIVGNCPSFDEETLSAFCYSQGYEFHPYHHLIDTASMSYGYQMAKGTFVLDSLPVGSTDLSKAIGCEPPAGDEHHTALGDAIWSERWFATLMGAQ